MSKDKKPNSNTMFKDIANKIVKDMEQKPKATNANPQGQHAKTKHGFKAK